MEKKLDLRVQKTHKALLNALQELLCEKSFDEITVTELCERAQTRKATFYKHFGDKNEIFTYMIKELRRKYNEKNEIDYDSQCTQTYCAGVLRFFLDFFEQNEEVVLKILQSGARCTALDILYEQTEADMKSHFKEEQERGAILQTSPDFLAAIYTGAIVYSARWWIMAKKRPPKDEIVSQVAFLAERL